MSIETINVSKVGRQWVGAYKVLQLELAEVIGIFVGVPAVTRAVPAFDMRRAISRMARFSLASS
jgi:hypothetical protein